MIEQPLLSHDPLLRAGGVGDDPSAASRPTARPVLYLVGREDASSTEVPASPPERVRDRQAEAKLVGRHVGLAASLARRFANRGESFDDLNQVALVGLWKAVQRFDPERGVEFTTYAAETITGEIKRHFRDHTWAVRPPRGLQELSLRATVTVEELGHRLGRSPTVAEVATDLGVEPERVVEAMEAWRSYRSASLDAPAPGEEGERMDRLGRADPALDMVEHRQLLSPLVARLPKREQEVLRLRFAECLTQRQIAEHVGVSQVHVSRLLARSLAKLRTLAQCEVLS